MSTTPLAPSNAPFVHNWNAPQHRNLPDPPPSHEGYPTSAPLPLHRLHFNPLGMYELRRHLGVFQSNPNQWNSYRSRWLSADLAWFASGASEDGQHHPGGGDAFFPEFHALRASLPSRREAGNVGPNARKAFYEGIRMLLFDVATMLDRTFGSTTMIMHSVGTAVPGTPALPEYLRCSVYLPPAFIRRHPEAHQPIADIVQSYIQSVGVPTVVKWVADARARGWYLTQTGPRPHPNQLSTLVIPPPENTSSAHYIFRGRPAGIASPAASDPLPNPLPTPAPAPAPAAAPDSPASSDYGSDDGEVYSDSSLALLAAYEQIAAWQAEVEGLRSHLDSFDDISRELGLAIERERGYIEQQAGLRADIAALQAQLVSGAVRSQASLSSSRGPFTNPPLYSVSQPSTPTRNRPPLTLNAPSRGGRSLSPVKSSQELPLPATMTFLGEHGLGDYGHALRLMVRCVTPAKWYEELAGLGVDEAFRSALIDCLTEDSD
ncbi:hypothetical protein DFH09DRAFT_1347255 [Mycena vulgaris]|nr:hypothetical protein DFH09DRAFT_1347255 [Mycena vulgaris]